MNSREETFDVVVVGAGGAGLAAAIEAAQLGRSVVLLEKGASPGGSTAWSVGSVSASSTPHQLRKGIKDGPADHWRDMAGFNEGMDDRDNPELRRVLADDMPDTFRWLLKHGIRFFGPMPEAPHRKPRMHNVLPNSRSFITNLTKAARRAGVTVRTNTKATSLVTAKGRVIAVECQDAGGPSRYRARGGIVLATGDFTNASDLKEQFMGAQQAKIEAVNVNATGDGQKMALMLGARILNGDLAIGPELRFVPPQKTSVFLNMPPWPLLAQFMAWSLEWMPPSILRPFIMSFVTTALAPSTNLFTEGAMLFNKNGQQFASCDENPAFRLPDQPEKVAYILLDDRMTKLFSAWPHFISTAPGVAYAYIDDYRRNRSDIFTQAQSLDDLSNGLGIRPGALAATIIEYNKTTNKKIGDGPYVALGPVRSVFVLADGGLAVDGRQRVLNESNTPIDGLYAAGSTGQGGLLLRGHGHHLAWAFSSGRRAGREAAFLATTENTIS